MSSPLIIFDSGIGGFSILKELMGNGPPEIIYIADQAFFPYGDKTNAAVTERVSKTFNWSQQFSPSAYLLACNTATTASIAKLRELADIPIIGVEPVIKPLKQFARSALIATPLTASSPSTKKLMKDWQGGHVDIVGVPDLATAIEDMNDAKSKSIIDNLANKLPNIDAIGLSCTHYSLISSLLKEAFPDRTIIDPSLAVADRVRSLIPELSENPNISFYTTGKVVRLEEQIKRYLGFDTHALKAQI